MTVSFSMTFRKNLESRDLFNLTYASDQLIKGVSWCTVNQNCACAVLKLSGMPLNEKNSKLQMVTVKKQNIVIEYVCCECATTRDPIHVKYAVFSFTHSNSAQVYSCLCVLLKVCSMAEHRPEVATNLKQLPYRMKQSSSMAADIQTGQRQ